MADPLGASTILESPARRIQTQARIRMPKSPELPIQTSPVLPSKAPEPSLQRPPEISSDPLHVKTAPQRQIPVPADESSLAWKQNLTSRSFVPTPQSYHIPQARSPVRETAQQIDSPPARHAAIQQRNGDLDGRMTAEALRERDRTQGFVRIRMLGTDRAKKDVWLKLEASTNLSTYHNAHVKAFSRSYAEFVGLHGALCANHPQIVIPALPIPATSALSEEEEDRIVRGSFQRWFDRITSHSALARDEELRSFLESNFGYQPTTIRRRLKPSTSYKLPLSKSKPYEEEDELSGIRSEMGRLETIFSDVARAMDKSGQNRRSLSVSFSELADQLAAFATTETHPPLATGFRKMGDGIKRLADVNAGLAAAELITLADALMYESAEAREAKDALQQRQLIVDEYRTASKSAITKKRNIEKLRGANSIKPERVDEALEEFDDAHRHELNLSEKLKAISADLEPSVRQHIREMHDNLLNGLLHHAKAGLLYEKQNLKELDALRTAIKNIPAKTVSATYVPTVPPVASSKAPEASHSRAASITSTNGDFARDRRAASDAGTVQSPVVGPTHQRAATQVSSPRTNQLAKSVVLPVTPSALGDDPLAPNSLSQSTSNIGSGRTKAVDERRRVDASMAASKLANAFF